MMDEEFDLDLFALIDKSCDLPVPPRDSEIDRNDPYALLTHGYDPLEGERCFTPFSSHLDLTPFSSHLDLNFDPLLPSLFDLTRTESHASHLSTHSYEQHIRPSLGSSPLASNHYSMVPLSALGSSTSLISVSTIPTQDLEILKEELKPAVAIQPRRKLKEDLKEKKVTSVCVPQGARGQSSSGRGRGRGRTYQGFGSIRDAVEREARELRLARAGSVAGSHAGSLVAQSMAQS